MMPGVLDGVCILAVEQFGAGPFGTLHLADLGAEVIKIEEPNVGGDIARSVPPYTIPGDSLYFQSFNRNKRSITLNLKHAEGRRVFLELAGKADAVFNNLRGDLPDKLGLTYAHLKAVNPAIVCCSLSGFGLDGPRHAEPAYDYLMQAYAGWMSLTGDPDSPPTKSGLSVVDYAGGVIAMLGLVSGLFHAQRSGQGCDVDVSLLDTAVSMLSYVAIWALNRDYQPRRMADSAHPSLTPAQTFQTADGYIVLFCAKEKFWQALAEVLDAEDGSAPRLVGDARFASFASRDQYREPLLGELKRRFGKRTTADWLERLRGKAPCAPVNSLAEALTDEQVLAREMIVEVEHPEFGRLRQTRTAIHIDNGAGADTRQEEWSPAPALGADTASVLQSWLGYSEQSISALRAVGAI
ncbi:MAG: CoA transferase [Caldilineaceae bacterium]|nr:CoA transferase [Caldilineaceae bacterium]